MTSTRDTSATPPHPGGPRGDDLIARSLPIDYLRIVVATTTSWFANGDGNYGSRALLRSAAFASRVPSGARSHRCSMVAVIDVVS